MCIKHHFLLLLLCSCLSCAGPEHSYQRLVGDWQYLDPARQGPLTLSFKPNYQYEVDFHGDGAKDIWGKIELFQNKIKMTEEKAAYRTDCRQAGFYDFQLTNEQLVFLEFADECLPRKFSLVHPRKKLKK